MTTERAERLLALDPSPRRAELARMSDRQRRALRWHWRLWAHDGQLAPALDWDVWLVMAGRGFGKTRAGAEWVRSVAETDGSARIALVGASLAEARMVMVEGPSGLLMIAPPGKRPVFEPSKRTLTWPGGAVATLYSAGEPESLRGPQHSHACRTGATRGLRQRCAQPVRRAATSRDRGRDPGSPARPCRRGVLASGGRGHRGVCWPRGTASLPPDRPMDLRGAARRDARARPLDRPASLAVR